MKMEKIISALKLMDFTKHHFRESSIKLENGIRIVYNDINRNSLHYKKNEQLMVGKMDLEQDQKLILYAIGALDKPLRSKVKLHKLFFLVSNAFTDLNNLFEFEPHLFGPYSEEVDNVTSELIKLGYVSKKGSSFNLTHKGSEEVKRLKPKNEFKKIIYDFKEFLNDIPDDKILTFIYVFYPDYIEESSKWEELKKSRTDTALYFLKKGKISFSKAVKMSGKPFKEFDELTKEKKIQWRA